MEVDLSKYKGTSKKLMEFFKKTCKEGNTYLAVFVSPKNYAQYENDTRDYDNGPIFSREFINQFTVFGVPLFSFANMPDDIFVLFYLEDNEPKIVYGRG